MPGFKLNAENREDLSDARLLLDTAAHNAQVALRNPIPEEAREALDSALRQTQQAALALERVQSRQAV